MAQTFAMIGFFPFWPTWTKLRPPTANAVPPRTKTGPAVVPFPPAMAAVVIMPFAPKVESSKPSSRSRQTTSDIVL